jgi:hypothetical protein
MLDYDLWNSFDQIAKRTMDMMTKKDKRTDNTDYVAIFLNLTPFLQF